MMMFKYTPFTAVIVLLVSLICFSHIVSSASVMSRRATGSTAVQCKYGDWATGKELDLSPLSAKNALKNGLNWKLTSKDGHTFLLNVCDYLISNATDPNNGCGTNSFGCQLSSNNKYYSIGTNVTNTGIYVENINSPPLLEYVKGTECSTGDLRSSAISFICDKTVPSNNGPSSVSEENKCEYQFTWRTPLACLADPTPASDSGFATTFTSSNGDYFDVSSLKKLTGNYVIPMNNGSIVLNIGQPLNGLDFHPEAAPNCDSNAGGCHLWTDLDPTLEIIDYHARSIGKASTGKFYLDTNGKLNYNMTGGSAYSSGLCYKKERSTNIVFECAGITGVPTFLFEANCAYYFLWATSAACSTTAPESSSGLSGFSVFVIIFFVLVVVYFLGGCMYKRHFHNAKGWEQLPNYSLWSKCGEIITCSSRRGQMERTRVGGR